MYWYVLRIGDRAVPIGRTPGAGLTLMNLVSIPWDSGRANCGLDNRIIAMNRSLTVILRNQVGLLGNPSILYSVPSASYNDREEREPATLATPSLTPRKRDLTSGAVRKSDTRSIESKAWEGLSPQMVCINNLSSMPYPQRRRSSQAGVIAARRCI